MLGDKKSYCAERAQESRQSLFLLLKGLDEERVNILSRCCRKMWSCRVRFSLFVLNSIRE